MILDFSKKTKHLISLGNDLRPIIFNQSKVTGLSNLLTPIVLIELYVVTTFQIHATPHASRSDLVASDPLL